MTSRVDPGVVTGLSVEHLSKTFGATRALDDVSFAVGTGRIHGLLGGNGSGKSTLIKILAGVHQGDAGGTIRVAGGPTPADHTSPGIARDQGLRFVHQDQGVFEELTVAENMALGAGFPTRAGRIRWRALREHTRHLLDRFAIQVSPTAVLRDLRPADRTMVAIARALQDQDESSVSVLVLDEPTASLPEQEVDVLLDALRRYAEQGQTILYVSHRLDEVLSIVDSMTILRDGRHVVTRDAGGVTKEQLIHDIVGRPLKGVFAERPEHSAVKPVFSARGLSGGPVRDLDFDVGAGEVLGIAGLLGSGRTEILRMIFGAHSRDGGTLTLNGRAVDPRSPGAAMREGIAYVAEDRLADAAFPDLSVVENLAAGTVDRYWRLGRFARRRERNDAEESIREFSIRAGGHAARISTLSGGNQQKVILARWLRRDPQLMLLDEPTQGVDVGARADVYEAIRRHVDQGMAAVLVSSDFEELSHAADRVLVLQDGRFTHEVAGDDLSSRRLTELVHSHQEIAA